MLGNKEMQGGERTAEMFTAQVLVGVFPASQTCLHHIILEKHVSSESSMINSNVVLQVNI